MAVISGARILVSALEEQGVENVFGYPGGSVLSVYDALGHSSIRHILTSHEQGAAFAAEGYARASGRAGVVLTTSGPGATNLITGIADAYMDSVPLIAITGNVALENLGHDSFQEVDIFGMTMPVTKYNFIVKSAADIAPVVRKAFKIALTGRRGPVLIDIPSNVFDEKAPYEKQLAEKYAEELNSVSPGELSRAAELIKQAKRPLIYAGGGVRASGAGAELSEFALKICAPVTVSYMGVGCFDADDESYLGVLSDINSTANAAIKECDLLITLGARFNSRYSAFGAIKKLKIPVLQIDVDRAEIDKNVIAAAGVQGDIKTVLSALTPKIPACTDEYWAFRDFPVFEETHRGAEIIKTVNALLPDATYVTDVGLHQVWAAHHLKVRKPEKFLTSGGLGAMGFSIGAAIGAHLAGGGICVAVTGDGSFNMNMNELTTAVKHRIPLVVLILNNNSLGMIRKMQLDRGNKQTPASSLYLNVDYVKLAEAMGARGVRIDETDDLKPSLKEALKGSLPVVIDCRISINTGI